MTSRVGKARIPGKAQEIVLSEDQWKSIEQAYGHSLSLLIRVKILVATGALSVMENMELNAPAQKTIKAKTENLRQAAQSLLQEVGHEVKEEDAARTSFVALTEALTTAVKEFPNDHLQFLMMVHSIATGCNLMLRTWESDEGLREGSIWDAWVQTIGKIVGHDKLPSAAWKDRVIRKPDQLVSQFVRLIDALQELVPKELRRHTQSLDALAGAIHRARNSNWLPDLLPKNLTDDERAFIEAPEERAKRYKTFTDMLASDPNWIQRSPGSFISVEIARLIEQAEEKKTAEVEAKSRDG